MLIAMQLPVSRMLNSIASLALNKTFYRTIFLPLARLINRSADTASILIKRRATYEHNTRDRLAQIKVPTLIITGIRDRIIKPSSSAKMAELIPNARLVLVENGSHVFY